MNAVIDRIPGDNQSEVCDVKHAGIGAVRVANLDHHEIMSFERETVGRDRTTDAPNGVRFVSRRQYNSAWPAVARSSPSRNTSSTNSAARARP